MFETNEMTTKSRQPANSYHPPGRKVIEGVPKIGYGSSGFMKCTTFGAALESVMNFLDSRVDYEYIMFTSGAAFHQTWKDGWFQGNSSILTMCEDPFEPIHRGMNAVGHEYTIRMCSGVDNFGVKASARKSAYVTGMPVDEAIAKEEIVSSIDKGIPVLAIGVIDVPEWCIVAGYDDGGDTLLGWSYFQDNPQVRKDPNGYFMKSDWFKDTQGYLLIGGKKVIPPIRQLCIDTLRFAVRIARTPLVNGDHSGLQAYVAWANQLTNDSFEGLDMPVIWERFTAYLDGLIMPDERKMASRFLRRVAKEEPDIAADLERAADLWQQEADQSGLWGQYVQQNIEGAKKFADPTIRKRLANQLLRCRELGDQATRVIESLLARID